MLPVVAVNEETPVTADPADAVAVIVPMLPSAMKVAPLIASSPVWTPTVLASMEVMSVTVASNLAPLMAEPPSAVTLAMIAPMEAPV